MTLPVPIPKNWKEQFGSQVYPAEAAAGAASYVSPPVITSITLGAGGQATAVVTRSNAGTIDWGDGTAPAVMAAGSANLTHTYTRLGNFGVTIQDGVTFANVRQRFLVNSLA